MQTFSPTVDRIGAALKALRQTHRHDAQSEDKLSLGANCLHVVTAQLAEAGLPGEDLQPLIDLEASLRQIIAQMRGESVANRHKQRPPSEILLARGAPVIDPRRSANISTLRARLRRSPPTSGCHACSMSGSGTAGGSKDNAKVPATY